MEWYWLGPNLHFYVANDDKHASATVTNNFRSTQKLTMSNEANTWKNCVDWEEEQDP